MMSQVRRAVGLEFNFQDGLKQYNIETERLDTIDAEIKFLAAEYVGVTENFRKALNQYPDKKDSFNKRYNSFFSDYIGSVKVAKKSKLQISKSLSVIIKATPLLKEYIEIENRVGDDGYKFKFTDYMPLSLGYNRKELPQISKDNVNEVISELNDSNITVNKVSIPLNIIKPSQNEFLPEKVIKFIKNTDWKFNPIISKDLYLTDQHHRFAALLEEDEDMIVDCWLINLPFEELIERIKKSRNIKKSAMTILQYAYSIGKLSKEEYLKVNEYK
jgi:hypothetical protein